MHTNSIRTKNGFSIFVTVTDRGSVLSFYSDGMHSSITFDNVDARALAERIINAVDNHQLTTIKEQDHAELRN
jgi:hypothetical protein